MEELEKEGKGVTRGLFRKGLGGEVGRGKKVLLLEVEKRWSWRGAWNQREQKKTGDTGR